MPGEYTLCPKGEIDLSTAPLLRAEWEAAVDVHRPERLIVDLSDVTFLDSSGISLIVTIYKRQRSRGGVVVIKNAPEIVRTTLRITRVDTIIDVLGNEDAQDERVV
jgi:anti-sigma B factor antagonist